MTVSPQYVADHFDEITAAVESGEVVEVALPRKAGLRLVATPRDAADQSGQRILGAGIGEMKPLSYAEWDRIDREWKSEFAEKFEVAS